MKRIIDFMQTKSYLKQHGIMRKITLQKRKNNFLGRNLQKVLVELKTYGKLLN